MLGSGQGGVAHVVEVEGADDAVEVIILRAAVKALRTHSTFFSFCLLRMSCSCAKPGESCAHVERREASERGRVLPGREAQVPLPDDVRRVPTPAAARGELCRSPGGPPVCVGEADPAVFMYSLMRVSLRLRPSGEPPQKGVCMPLRWG